MKSNIHTNQPGIVTDTGIPALIDQINFERIKYKLMVSEKEEKWTFEKCEIAEREYKRFLTLIKLNPGKSIVPTQLMDKFWHQHILDTVAYAKDCNLLFGFFLHHFPYFGIYGEEDRSNLAQSFEETKSMYKAAFGEDLPAPEASRCKDHACHVESECACRVEGACKNE